VDSFGSRKALVNMARNCTATYVGEFLGELRDYQLASDKLSKNIFDALKRISSNVKLHFLRPSEH